MSVSPGCSGYYNLREVWMYSQYKRLKNKRKIFHQQVRRNCWNGITTEIQIISKLNLIKTFADLLGPSSLTMKILFSMTTMVKTVVVNLGETTLQRYTTNLNHFRFCMSNTKTVYIGYTNHISIHLTHRLLRGQNVCHFKTKSTWKSRWRTKP